MSALLLLVAAATPFYWESKSWSISEAEHDCSAYATYTRGQDLYISYDRVLANVFVMITDPSFASVTKGKKYELQLYFLKGDRVDKGWGNVDATGFVIDADGKVPAKRGVSFKLAASDALKDFKTSETVGLMRGDVLVSSLALADSAAAITQLESCSAKVAKTSPSDPLNGAEKN